MRALEMICELSRATATTRPPDCIVGPPTTQ